MPVQRGSQAADDQWRLWHLPQTMFVLIPIFAAMLALFYVFRRRLYMEHLIVALHSHAFMFLSLLLILLAGMLSTWLKPHGAWMAITLGWVEILLIWWIPIYLLIMQKRVYRQGWPMTVLKYLVYRLVLLLAAAVRPDRRFRMLWRMED
jgi:hypothetical protein